jgi:hypothetical protein
MLKKGVKWKWTAHLQQAFEELLAQFAKSIHLIHPNDELPYSIFTDASTFTIGALLMQTDENGETYIVSSASRVWLLVNKSTRLVKKSFYLLFMQSTNSEYTCLVIRSCLELTIRLCHFYKTELRGGFYSTRI